MVFGEEAVEKHMDIGHRETVSNLDIHLNSILLFEIRAREMFMAVFSYNN